MSNDINRFNFAVTYLPSVLLAPVEVSFAVGLLAWLLGWPTLLGVVTIAFFTLLQVYCARKIASLREKAVSFSDERVSLTSEVVRGIRLIKMCTWEESYEQCILDARRLVFYLLTGYWMFCNIRMNCECIRNIKTISLNVLNQYLNNINIVNYICNLTRLPAISLSIPYKYLLSLVYKYPIALYIHTCVHYKRIHTQIHYKHTCIHTYIHYKHTYIHTYTINIHTYIHTYIHTDT